MFLKKVKLYKEIPVLIGISIYSYFVNWQSGNIGVMPIDSFGFLDTGYSITKGHLPIRDFWIFTGLLVDYMEALFLFIFGNNWNSHLAHSSFINILGTIGLYFFLKEYELKLFHIIFYCLSFATLCYPLSGTPFAYIHAYTFSILAIFNLLIAIKKKNSYLWFLFPYVCFFAFLSMQTPTAYILIILLIFIIYYFLKERDFKNLKIFLYGSITSILLFFFFLLLTKTPLINFIYQYILFPITIGEGRISSQETAYIGLLDQLNLKRILGEFKFIHFFLLPLIFLSLKNFKKNKKNFNILNFVIIFSTIAFFFNQLITANQIYIFSLVPILAAVIHVNLNNLKINPKTFYIILFVVLIASVKFHLRFNIDRKFHDLENIDKSKAVQANSINENLKNLNWISKFDQPNNELKVLKEAMKVIDGDNRKKTLITHYQFISTILDKPLYILNRWYLWDNNTHPTENHKYFEFYKSLVDKNIKKNKVKVVYLLGQKNEINFKNVKNYFTDTCFKSKTIVPDKFSMHEIVKCKK